jgi:alpha-1,3-rhamnosyl/mannosyltransferase
VLAGRKKWNTGDFDTLINTYKYKQDIVIADEANEEELIKISCSAYAFIYPPANGNSVLFGLDAMRYGVPVIANETAPLKEIAGTAALYCNASDVADIADKMMLVYKDETLRSRMIDDATAIASTYTWQGAAATIWQSIETEAN